MPRHVYAIPAPELPAHPGYPPRPLLDDYDDEAAYDAARAAWRDARRTVDADHADAVAAARAAHVAAYADDPAAADAELAFGIPPALAHLADGPELPQRLTEYLAPRLGVAAGELIADGADRVLVTYTHEGPDAPAEVTFTVNGTITPPVPLVDGRAELNLAASTPGRVRIEVAGLRTVLTARTP